ncbi:glycosyl hydrolase catalytic core-domain-containing protein [Xylariomycetidae sp. FL0641]|nr:glycosyl hydrolase catalytic core-domain-containing protein [Xylariomycetidae sp. FL0641]
MRPWAPLPLVAIASVAGAQTTRSAKRGLVFVPSDGTPEDNQIWVRSGSDLTWYYNYGDAPSPAYAGISQDEFEFVPMLWGAVDGTAFLASVRGLLADGRHVRHVLAFNEPDMAGQYGGSDLAPADAAEVWVRNVAPLGEQDGIKLGLPACSSAPSGIPWLQQFLGNCSDLISGGGGGGSKRNCSYDFVPMHYYGDFEGLASHMGEYAAAFPNVSQWLTEYNLDNADLASTQSFYNQSAQYLDRLDSVGRYTYFGSFRSGASNVGPNAAMLNNAGRLTDIGSWYLGGAATGVEPKSAAVRGRRPGGMWGLGTAAAVAVVSLMY